MIHKNNHVHTTREGYILKENMNDFPLVEYTGKNTTLYNLSQGMYRITINGTQYAFLLHDVLGGSDRIVINDENDAYTIIALRKRPLYLYKINEGTIIDAMGYQLKHSVNDRIDILAMDGCTRVKEPPFVVDLNHPRKMDFTSTYNIRITKQDESYEDYIFGMRSYLKSMKIDTRTTIADRIYVEGASNRALFLFKLGRLVLSGYEPFVKVDEFSSNEMNVFWYDNKMVKVGSYICCSHFNTITWDEMRDKTFNFEGICSGGTEQYQGFFIKVKKSDYPEWNDVRAKILEWYTMTNNTLHELRMQEYSKLSISNYYKSYEDFKSQYPIIEYCCPITIEYELTNYEYRQLALDNYKLPTYFNNTSIAINPYEVKNFSRYLLSNIIGIVPKNGIIKSIAEQEQESGKTEFYYRILEENRILRNILSNQEYVGTFEVHFEDDYITTITNNNITGSTNRYARILQENTILRELFSRNIGYKFPVATVNDSNMVALIPKNGIIKTEEEHDAEQGAEYYDQIIDENYILRDLAIAGEYNIKASYFYKHLRLNT